MKRNSFLSTFGGLSQEEQSSIAGTLLAMVTFLAGLAQHLEPLCKMVTKHTDKAFDVFVADPDGMDADPIECIDLASEELGNSLFGGLSLVRESIIFVRSVFSPGNDLFDDAQTMTPFLAKVLSKAGVADEDECMERIMEMMADFLTVNVQEIAMDGEE